jgi:hypothetical protein
VTHAWASNVFREGKLPCLLVKLRFLESGKRGRLLGEMEIVLESVCLEWLRERGYTRDYYPDKPMPKLVGEYVAVVGTMSFVVHFGFSGVALQELFEERFGCYVGASALRLPLESRVVFSAQACLAKVMPRKARPAAATATITAEGAAWDRLAPDVKAIILSVLPFPDLLSMMQTCKAVAALCVARRPYIVANLWMAKMAQFVACIVPLRHLLLAWCPETPMQLREERPERFPVLQGVSSVSFLFERYFMPCAMRIKTAGASCVRVRASATDMRWPEVTACTGVVTARDREWFALSDAASARCCLFRLEFVDPLEEPVTDVQVMGLSASMLWVAPFWLFVMRDARRDVREQWWGDALRDLGPLRGPCPARLLPEDLLAMTSLLQDDRVSDSWKRLVLHAVHRAELQTRSFDGDSCAHWVDVTDAAIVRMEPFIEPLAQLMLRLVRKASSEELVASVLRFSGGASLIGLPPEELRPLALCVPVSSCLAQTIINFAVEKQHLVDVEFFEVAVDLLVRMVLANGSKVTPDAFRAALQPRDAMKALETVARKYCGHHATILAWIAAHEESHEHMEAGDKAKTERVAHWRAIRSEFVTAKPRGTRAVSKAILANRCTAEAGGEARQAWYRCLTCKAHGVCVSCATNCHREHNVLLDKTSSEVICKNVWRRF